MAKKRRKKKKNRSTTGDHSNGYHESGPLPRGEDYIDTDIIRLCRELGIPVSRSLFKDGGFRCTICGFTTRKLGTPGRNSLRAHIKRHIHEFRAGRRFIALAWIGIALTLAVSATFLYLTLDLPSPVSVIAITDASLLAGISITTISVATGLLMIWSAALYASRYRVLWRRVFIASVLITFMLLATSTGMAFYPSDVEVEWYWLVSPIIPIGLLLLVGKSVGMTTLLVSRREVKPRLYIKMLKSISASGDEAVDEIYLEIMWMIRKKKIILSDLEQWQRQALITLGIPGLRYRLKAES